MFSEAHLDTLSDGIFAVAMTLSILDVRLVSLRLVQITRHLEQGGHLQRRQISAWLLIASSPLAIAISFVDPQVARWALALNFATPVIRVWSKRARALD